MCQQVVREVRKTDLVVVVDEGSFAHPVAQTHKQQLSEFLQSLNASQTPRVSKTNCSTFTFTTWARKANSSSLSLTATPPLPSPQLFSVTSWKWRAEENPQNPKQRAEGRGDDVSQNEGKALVAQSL